jgi:hypothetical protein
MLAILVGNVYGIGKIQEIGAAEPRQTTLAESLIPMDVGPIDIQCPSCKEPAKFEKPFAFLSANNRQARHVPGIVGAIR